MEMNCCWKVVYWSDS